MPKPRATASIPSTPEPRKVPARKTGKKVTCASSTHAPVPVFDPAEHHAAIAKSAYLNWQARGDAFGSAEDDWLRAENEVRAAFNKSLSE